MFTTINRDFLWGLPTYNVPPTMHLEKYAPNEGEPPGHPAHFMQVVHTRGGCVRNKGVQTVIEDDGALYVVARSHEDADIISKRLRALWIPLPLKHPLIRKWVAALYCRYQGMYRNPATQRFFTLPMHEFWHFVDNEGFTEADRIRERAAVTAHNELVMRSKYPMHNPDNHCAVRTIRKFYPEYQPELDLIANPRCL